MDSDLQAPASGRRRAAGPARRSGVRGWSLPRLLAAGVALVGLLLVLAGALQATVLAASPTSRAVLLSPRQPVLSTAVGLLGLDGPRVQVDVTDSSKRPVFVGIGRAADVDAYLAQVSRLELDGHDADGTLLTKRLGSQAALPDPGGVDVWVASARGTGAAGLVWPDAPGQWRLVAATDGTAKAPDQVRLTWSGREVHSLAPALIAAGLVLAVVGLITLVMLRSRSGLEREP